MTKQNTASWITKALPALRPRPTGHDPLCLLTTENYDIPLTSCWCRCPKCWDRQAQRCICRHCPCPASDRGMGPRYSAMHTSIPDVRPSERTAGRQNLGHTSTSPTMSPTEAGLSRKRPGPKPKKGQSPAA